MASGHVVVWFVSVDNLDFTVERSTMETVHDFQRSAENIKTVCSLLSNVSLTTLNLLAEPNIFSRLLIFFQCLIRKQWLIYIF